MNAYKRLHGLYLANRELDWNLTARLAPTVGGADHHMNRPAVPRRWGSSSRRPARPIGPPVPGATRRLQQGHRMTSTTRVEADVRHELVARVRREIVAGTYDTPDKFEAALDCMAERFGS